MFRTRDYVVGESYSISVSLENSSGVSFQFCEIVTGYW
jgi:hypothetical protein